MEIPLPMEAIDILLEFLKSKTASALKRLIGLERSALRASP
jgi:hypothetical protein